MNASLHCRCNFKTPETSQIMVVWPLPITRKGCTLGDSLTEYLADQDIDDWVCFSCGSRVAVMKRTVVSWPRFVFHFFFLLNFLDFSASLF
jgi:hypothetical protein